MIQRIEQLPAELHANLFPYRKGLVEREASVDRPRGAEQSVGPRDIAEFEGERQAERGPVEITRSAGDAAQPVFDAAAGERVRIGGCVAGAGAAISGDTDRGASLST